MKKVKEACKPSLILQTLKRKFSHCREIQFVTEFTGRKFLTDFSHKTRYSGVNLRGTGKTRVFGSNCGKGHRFLKKVKCRGYFSWPAGSAGTCNFLDPILDPVQETTCGPIVKGFPRTWYPG
jgi:hypothetical protein